jgi:hypothetical protein
MKRTLGLSAESQGQRAKRQKKRAERGFMGCAGAETNRMWADFLLAARPGLGIIPAPLHTS